jgi:hypothetical protein
MTITAAELLFAIYVAVRMYSHALEGQKSHTSKN